MRGGEAGICDASQAKVLLEAWLRNPNILLVGANVAFDMAVICEAWPDLRPLVFDAYNNDRVTDVQHRQRLLDIAGGVYKGKLVGKDIWIPHRYDLASLAKRCAGMDLQKDEWRLSYGEFIGVPLEEWPAHALVVQAKAKDTLAELEEEWG